MNDFKMNLEGCQGVMKETAFFKPKASEEERTFTILSGPGCSPDANTRRQIKVKWNDDSSDTLSSYDMETLITKDGNRLKQTEPVFTDFDRATAPGDVKDKPKEETKTKPRMVRRKA